EPVGGRWTACDVPWLALKRRVPHEGTVEQKLEHRRETVAHRKPHEPRVRLTSRSDDEARHGDCGGIPQEPVPKRTTHEILTRHHLDGCGIRFSAHDTRHTCCNTAEYAY